MTYDLVIKNARIVRPGQKQVFEGDIGITGGEFANIQRNITEKANQTYDARGLLAFPGVVDAHMHAGIYSPLKED
ncbi:MAG TPA: hydantoinase, partial [Burkholderiales bacterium]|nr:hydantoinase [Burkholderiales bacterium]